MKKLRPGEIRFEVRKVDKLFRVYDRARGSYPYALPELGGKIVQDVPEAEAQEEAARLNKKYGTPPSKKADTSSEADSLPRDKKKRAQKTPAKTVEAKPSKDSPENPELEEADEIVEFDLPDYGEASEEEVAAYTDGIFEKTVY